jgi:hypothetical protein
MKKIFLLVAFFATVLAQKSFAQDSLKQYQLSKLLTQYYNIKDALVAGNANTAASEAEEYVKTLNGIEFQTISEGNANSLLKDASHISESKDIAHQREHFANLSNNMFALAKAVKLTSAPVYQDYCPMKKAYWLSSDKAIKNPYYGVLCLPAVRSRKHCNSPFNNSIINHQKQLLMKNTFLIIAAAAISFAACNSNNNAAKESSEKTSDTSQAKMPTSNTAEQKTTTPVNDIITHYLHLKNALTNDDANEAADAGKHIVEAINKIDKSTFSADQKKVYDDVGDDIKENAEHIGENASKIAHQREHFEMLSNDVYDLLKAFKTNQTLYKDFCPMAGEGKGAIWISETKEIKNPYQGKKMPTCGSVKEEIK